jgi:hypothetical protein
MMAWMGIGVVILLAILLGFFLFAALASRGNEKRRHDEYVKPKRDENERLILAEDGELIDYPPLDSKEDDAHRSRDS